MDSSSSDGSFIDVAESYSNIAPIMDAVIADTDDGVQVVPYCADALKCYSIPL